MTFSDAIFASSLLIGVFLSAANIKQTHDINRQARDINSTLTKQIAAAKLDTPAASPKPQCDAAEAGKCECFDKGGCKCAAGKQCANSLTPKPETTSGLNVCQKHILVPGDVAHIPAPPAVKAAPIAAPKYTQPQPAKAVVTSPSHPHHIAATHVLRWQPSYGPFGRERGGQWVRVPVQQARQYRAPQPTYRTYRSCANGSCR